MSGTGRGCPEESLKQPTARRRQVRERVAPFQGRQSQSEGDLVATKLLAAAITVLIAVIFVPAATAAGMTAVGAATPASVPAGGSTLLTVTVTPADSPPSTGIGVACNLGPLGGGMTL